MLSDNMPKNYTPTGNANYGLVTGREKNPVDIDQLKKLWELMYKYGENPIKGNGHLCSAMRLVENGKV